MSLRDVQGHLARPALPCADIRVSISLLLVSNQHSNVPLQLLTKPAHSIINQAFDSRLRVDRRNPINGDGFGVGELRIFPEMNGRPHRSIGWYDTVYDEELGSQPCIFTSVTPVSV